MLTCATKPEGEKTRADPEPLHLDRTGVDPHVLPPEPPLSSPPSINTYRRVVWRALVSAS
ncbi:unnamed protein product [Brassica rapa subsp. trilocularis]